MRGRATLEAYASTQCAGSLCRVDTTIMPQDALNSLRSLLGKVPNWIADLESILEKATERQNELLFENQPADSDKPLAREPSKSSSLKSKPSMHERLAKEIAANIAKSSTPTPTLLRPQLPHMTESDALRLSQRKRKTFSACSRDQSGPSKYRSRALVVVYYDGDVQQRFTDLVRAFNSSRNDIRRSKLSARVDTLSRSGSSGSGSGSASDAGEDTAKSIGTTNSKKPRVRLHEIDPVSTPRGFETLDKVDALLEKSQSLCEHAAHQVLRDGDCAVEVRQAKQHLEQAKLSAERGVPDLEMMAAAAEENRRLEEQQRAERRKQLALPVESEKVELFAASPSESPLEVDDIEVDDEEDDTDTELEMAALKLPPNLTKYSMRGSRLTAC